MNIRLKLFLVLMLLMISVVLIASDHGLKDSLSTKTQDSSKVAQKEQSEKNNKSFSVGKEINPSNALAAIIGGLFTLLATYLGIKLKQRFDEKKEAKKEQKILATEEDRYLDFIITKNEKLTFQGFETAVKTPILLWDVYVPLRANVMGAGMRDAELGMRDTGLGERGEFQDHRDLSVEEAVQLATDKKYNGLIILGDPGAGKTTLLRYFLLCFAKKEAAKRLNLPVTSSPFCCHYEVWI
jgi:hypothetical protein